MVFVAVCMSACGMDVRGQADDPFSIERLTLYGTCTSVGVVAKGETFDENGRVAHVVYYSDPAKPHGGRALQAGEIIQADELYQAGEVPAAQPDPL